MLIVAATIVVAAVLFIILRPAGESEAKQTKTTPTTAPPQPRPPPPQPSPPAMVRLVVPDGKPVGAIRNVTVAKGRRIVLIVTSDVPDEVHLHGYDLRRNVAAGETVRLPFTATIVGTVEVELESRGLPLARITTMS